MGRSHFHLFPPWFPWRWSRAALPLRLIHQKIITLLPLGVLLWTLPSDELALGSRNPTGRSCWNLSEIVVFGNKILNIFQWCQKKSTVQRHRQTSRMIWGTSPSLWKLPKVRKDTEMARSENAEVLQIHYSKSDCWKIICFCWCQSSYLGYLDVFWVAFLLTSHPCDMISKGWHLNTQTRLVIYIYILYTYIHDLQKMSLQADLISSLASLVRYPKLLVRGREGLGWLSLGAFFQVENGWQKKAQDWDLRVGCSDAFEGVINVL